MDDFLYGSMPLTSSKSQIVCAYFFTVNKLQVNSREGYAYDLQLFGHDYTGEIPQIVDMEINACKVYFSQYQIKNYQIMFTSRSQQNSLFYDNPNDHFTLDQDSLSITIPREYLYTGEYYTFRVLVKYEFQQSQEDLSFMFHKCPLLAIDMEQFDMTSVQSIRGMFQDCFNLSKVIFSNSKPSDEENIDMSYFMYNAGYYLPEETKLQFIHSFNSLIDFYNTGSCSGKEKERLLNNRIKRNKEILYIEFIDPDNEDQSFDSYEYSQDEETVSYMKKTKLFRIDKNQLIVEKYIKGEFTQQNLEDLFSYTQSISADEFKIQTGTAVTSIADYAFDCSQKNFKKVTQVDMSKSSNLDSIGEKSFYKSGVKEVRFPSSLQRISDEAFSESLIESVEIPSSVNQIGKGLFSRCNSLKIVLWSSPCTVDGFNSCENLESITIEEGVQTIGQDQSPAFGYCKKLTYIEIPDSVTKISLRTFIGCSSLTQIIFRDNPHLQTIGLDAFRDCTSLDNVDIPESVQIISDYDNSIDPWGGVFSRCTGLTNVTFNFSADHTLQLGDCMFNGCSSLKKIVYTGTYEQFGLQVKKTSTGKNETWFPTVVMEGFQLQCSDSIKTYNIVKKPDNSYQLILQSTENI